MFGCWRSGARGGCRISPEPTHCDEVRGYPLRDLLGLLLEGVRTVGNGVVGVETEDYNLVDR